MIKYSISADRVLGFQGLVSTIHLKLYRHEFLLLMRGLVLLQ